MKNKLYQEIKRARLENAKISYLVLFAGSVLYFLYEFGSIKDHAVLNLIILAISIIAGPILFARYNNRCVAICPRCKTVVERPSIFKNNKETSCPNCGLIAEESSES